MTSPQRRYRWRDVIGNMIIRLTADWTYLIQKKTQHFHQTLVSSKWGTTHDVNIPNASEVLLHTGIVIN